MATMVGATVAVKSNVDTRAELHDVNGSLSLLVWQGDVLKVVMNLMIVDNQIVTINNVINPDKLAYIAHTDTPRSAE